ncbi:hypothetical protein OLMES_4926 [Oleiphilus messinensis]|uniref:Nucleoprotein/polynucleotide-associated enzyme n=1 Tax=Oleiphilus messinensis TaxID=141451 RepID=A0A1Y0IHQ3_9GAMM|nr:DUF2058 domain-containing protein [Oleiphilus messinensis]ARU58914.1 hypothetical protein OLMES_4926 [Oleiphilus messinensis]
MAKTLQEQLLQAGLVDQKKAKQIKQQKRKQKKQTPRGHEGVDEVKLATQKAREEKAEKDREKNRQLQVEAELRSLQAQVKQIIEMNRIARNDGEVGYQFTDGTKIKKIYVTEAQQNALAKGQIAIARLEELYELIPKGAAEKILQRNADAIVLLNQQDSQEEVDEDDPYADYQIPDDLMW